MTRFAVFCAVVLLAATSVAGPARQKPAPKPADPVPAPAAPAKAPGDTDGPRLDAVPLAGATREKDVVLTADIVDPSGVFGATAYFRLLGEDKFVSYPMQSKDDLHYSAIVPGARVTGDFEYYLEAYDSLGNGPTLSGSQTRPLQVPVAAPVAEPKPPVADTVIQSPTPALNVPAIAVASAGALAVIIGAVLYTGASSTVSEIDAKYTAKGAARLPADAEATRSAISKSRVGSVTMIGGLLVAAGGAAWLVLPMLPGAAGGGMTAEGGGAGLALEGSF